MIGSVCEAARRAGSEIGDALWDKPRPGAHVETRPLSCQATMRREFGQDLLPAYLEASALAGTGFDEYVSAFSTCEIGAARLRVCCFRRRNNRSELMSIRMNRPTKWIAGATLLAAVAMGGHAVGAAGKASTIQPAADAKWEPFAPGTPLQAAKLWGDRSKGAYGMLLKLPAGFEAGVHAHTADYKAILVSGTWIHTDEGQAIAAGKELAPGSYVLQPGKAMHNDKCKEGADCILFVEQNAKNDFIPPKK